jgi:lysophospholipase L1-like esterase
MSWKKILLVLLGIALLWGCYHWFQKEHYTNLPPSAQGPWIAFGDSLTEGFGADQGNDYPSILGKSLGISIRNLGRSGDTSSDGVKRLEAAAALHPSVVLLCFGGNDALNGEPQSRLFANVSTMIERFQREGSFVVLIGIRSASLRDRYEKPFHALAKQKQVLYVRDFLKGLAFKPVYMSDAVHPNDQGYKIFAERLEKELKPYLMKLKEKQERLLEGEETDSR